MSTPRTLTLVPLPSERRLRAGDDLAGVVLGAAAAADVTVADGDVVCIASKAVSKVEGAEVALSPGEAPEAARRRLARRHAARVVADTPRVLITETEHGYVCANGGIDRSNATAGTVLLLPDDPDASAARLREGIAARTGCEVGVVVTDTFGRPWRLGQTDVALGVAGTAALRDERGERDLYGHELHVTLVAVADELAAAADLTRRKGDGVPAVLVRGLDAGTGDGRGRDLLRPADEDAFRHGGPSAAEAAVTARRTIRSFTDEPVPGEVLRRAVSTAVTAPAPHGTRPWRFLRLTDRTRSRLLDAMASRWREDLRGDGTPEPTIEARIARSDAILREAPEVLLPLVSTRDGHEYPDRRRAGAERDMFLLSGGAALQGLQVVLAAHGLGAAWISSTLFCAPTVRGVLELADTDHPLGLIAVGRPAERPPPRGPRDPGGFLERR